MNKTALITGASRGVGKEIAHILAQNGCDLILCCQHNLKSMQTYAETLTKEYSISVSCHQGDIASPAFIETLFSQITHLDYLVNNAGISLVKLADETSYEEWQRVMAVNAGSVFLTCKKAIPLFLKNHTGSILNISSMWGQAGASMETVYSSSKGAVDAFTRALAKELAPSGISVNALSLGFIDTDMNKHLSDEERSAFFEEIPMGRPGAPTEAASMAYQILTSPSYLTGQVIRMDGGLI